MQTEATMDILNQKPTFEADQQYIVERLNSLLHITIMNVTRKCVKVKLENGNEIWLNIHQFESEFPNTPEYKIIEKIK